MGHRPGFGGALHGRYVVEDPDGTYRTLVTQRGEVTASSASSVTVRSEDGSTRAVRVADIGRLRPLRDL